MRPLRSRPAAFALALLSGTLVATRASAQNGCPNAPAGVDCGDPLPQLFPSSHPWNVKVTSAPVDANSTNIVNWIGSGQRLHPDFGGDDGTPNGIYGMVYFSVAGAGPNATPLEVVPFDYPDSDTGGPGRPPGYPIPVQAKANARWIEGGQPGHPPVGGDKHMLVVDRDNLILYELFNLRCQGATPSSCTWAAGSGATWKLDGTTTRPFGWTSGDAAGMPILPGLVRWDEAYGAAAITHAFRVTINGVNGFVYPASHAATTNTNVNAPPLGARMRLKPGFTLSRPPSGATPADLAAVNRVLAAMKEHGLVVTDTGSSMFVSGAYDTRWDSGVWNDVFHNLVHAGDFEVLQLGWGAGKFKPVTPCRVLDTRNPNGTYGGPAIGANAERVFKAAEQCGLPINVRSISGNLTVATPAASGILKLRPTIDPTSTAPTALSYATGKTRANNFVLKLSGMRGPNNTPDFEWGSFTIRNEGTQPVHVIVDVNGYFE